VINNIVKFYVLFLASAITLVTIAVFAAPLVLAIEFDAPAWLLLWIALPIVLGVSKTILEILVDFLC
jgi:hypothetical protein